MKEKELGVLRISLRRPFARLIYHLNRGISQRGFSSGRGTLILTYHRILNPPEDADLVIHPGLYVTPETFNLHLRYIRDRFRVISFKEFLEDRIFRVKGQKSACLITFDDGWQDNYKHAFPILKKYHMPATIFLPTAFIGTTKWFWQQRVAYQVKHLLEKGSLEVALLKKRQWLDLNFNGKSQNHRQPQEFLDSVLGRLKRLQTDEAEKAIAEMEKVTGIKVYPSRPQILNWQEIGEMSEEGIAFGSHGLSHHPFTELSHEETVNELVLSKKRIENRQINCVPVLAYPNGKFNQKIQFLARESGYKAAVTELPGFNSKENDCMILRRVGIHQDISSSLSLFALHINFAGRLR